MPGHVIIGVMTISTDVDKLYDTDLTDSLGADRADVAGSAARWPTTYAAASLLLQAKLIASPTKKLTCFFGEPLVHRLANNGDVVAFRMGRRQGARRAHPAPFYAPIWFSPAGTKWCGT